jgi:hypothetical protein
MDTPPHSQTTIFLRPIGSALPLGFFSFSERRRSACGRKPFFSVLLLLASTRMILSGLYEVGAGGKQLYEVSGGFALTALALYGGAALGLEDAHQREVLPLFRRAAAADSFPGYERQLERLEAEAGVRQQL